MYVPRMLASHVSSGERLAAPTCVCAPRWNTERTSCASRARPSSPGSVRSASTRVQRSRRPSLSKREPTRSDRLRATTASPRARRRSTTAQPMRPCAPVTKTVSGGRSRPASAAAGHGREDRDLVAVLDLGVEPVEEADVLATHVHVHEPAQVPVLGDPVAQALVALVEAVEDLAHRCGAIDRGLRVAT